MSLAGRDLASRRGGRPIFRGVDLDVPAGGGLILLGPNGAG
ncbi:MAG TPA: histidinol phosphatase, partial [Alphaproteobacteria bacterium]|nr:histidinol phosphatase [Alphaproteobacteria bacterium]